MSRQIPINRVVLGVLLIVLTSLYAPFYCSFATKRTPNGVLFSSAGRDLTRATGYPAREGEKSTARSARYACRQAGRFFEWQQLGFYQASSVGRATASRVQAECIEKHAENFLSQKIEVSLIRLTSFFIPDQKVCPPYRRHNPRYRQAYLQAPPSSAQVT